MDAFNLKAAHRGRSFFPWHREYLKRFEILLRAIEYETKKTTKICLPYWDSTLEKQLPTSKDSYLFTEDFIGSTNSDNQVINGPFSPWPLSPYQLNIEVSPFPILLEDNEYIIRNVGADRATPYKESDIAWQLNQTNIINIMHYFSDDDRCEAKTQFKADQRMPEFPHGTTHSFLGGFMRYADFAANDPIFYNHHCFVDLTWELWRQKQQKDPKQRPLQYPPDFEECSQPVHFRNSDMSMLNKVKNIDGCKNEYTDILYQYAPRPTCSRTNRNCGSKYMFCDLSNGTPHCAAKVKIDGNCAGFTKGEQVCYNGKCVNNVCVE
ncbi:hypothetical protein ACQ4LE_001165 [Meloidogyne hapla]